MGFGLGANIIMDKTDVPRAKEVPPIVKVSEMLREDAMADQPRDVVVRAADDQEIHDDIREGDWVRFYRNGQLIIGEVRYVKDREPYCKRSGISTDAGYVLSDSIIECRRVAEWITP